MADTIDGLQYPPVPNLKAPETTEDMQFNLIQLSEHVKAQAIFISKLMGRLADGTFIRDFQIDNLSAGKITTGIMTAGSIFIGDSHFELSGDLRQLIITDEQEPPVTRVKAGQFGSGDDYGIEIYRPDGTTSISARSTVFVDGEDLVDESVQGQARTAFVESIVSRSSITMNANTTTIFNESITHSLGREPLFISEFTFTTGVGLFAIIRVIDTNNTTIDFDVVYYNVSGSNFSNCSYTAIFKYW